MLSVLGAQPVLKINLVEILILKKYNVFLVVLLQSFCHTFCASIMQNCSVGCCNQSFLCPHVNSKSLPTHTNIHLFINILSHTCSFMSSSLFAFISRTQLSLLFYCTVIPELTADVFLLHVLGFNFFF